MRIIETKRRDAGTYVFLDETNDVPDTVKPLISTRGIAVTFIVCGIVGGLAWAVVFRLMGII